MAVPTLLFERVDDTGAKTLGIVVIDAHLPRHAIGFLKPHAPHVLDQGVGVALDDLDRVAAVGLVQLHRQSGGDAVGLQPHHRFADLTMFSPRCGDGGRADGADAGDGLQALGRIFEIEHAQGVTAEALHDAVGVDRSHAVDQAGGQVRLDAGARFGQGRVARIALDFELAAVARVGGPPAGQAQPLACPNTGQRADGCGGLDSIASERDHRVAVFVVVEDDALDGSFDCSIHTFSPLFSLARASDGWNTDGTLSTRRSLVCLASPRRPVRWIGVASLAPA